MCHGQGCTLGAGHGPPARDEALGAWGDAGLAEVEGLHSGSQVCLPGQTDQHDVIIVVLGAEVFVEPRVGEEVRDPDQLLRTLPFPEVVLPKADPQIPAGTGLIGQAESTRVLCDAPRAIYPLLAPIIYV